MGVSWRKGSKNSVYDGNKLTRLEPYKRTVECEYEYENELDELAEDDDDEQCNNKPIRSNKWKR